jgi:DNA polymerase-4
VRKIIHCDADCFFAAVEMRDDPRLRHIPLAIGGKPDQRGVISTCNYEARRFGVHSAMASWQALRLCPGLTLLPHNMEKYRAASKAMGAIFRDYTDRVEMVSVDEAYLDVSNSPYLSGSATLIAREIRARVKSEVGITVSAGVATNKFLAKIASEWHKPDGLFIIQPGQEQAFAADLAVKHLRGVGKVTAARLNSLGIETCKDLYSWPLADLLPHFGAFAPPLKELILGQYNREIVAQRVRKSLSVEHTIVADLGSKTSCLAQIPWLFSELNVRLGRLP